MSDREWFPIPGWERFYEVSNYGDVRSLPRVTTANQHLKGKVLAPNLTKHGYVMASLYRGSKRTAYGVHQLVMVAMEGPCPDGYEVCHRNGKRIDNRRENLYYGTRSENNLDAVAHGMNANANKTHCLHGHEFNADNTYWRLEGGRSCRRCRVIRQSHKRATRRLIA